MDEYINGELGSVIDGGSRPAFRAHVQFRNDAVRGHWVVVAPERVLTPNEQAADALRLCDGKRSVAEIAAKLAETYDAAPDAIVADIVPVVQHLVDVGVLRS